MSSEVFVAPAFFAMVAFIVWIVVTGGLRRQQLKHMTEFNGRLIERIGSVKDLGEFLQTEGGAKLLNSFTVERASTGVHERILRSSALGVVSIAVGIGFLYLGRTFTFTDHETFTVVGVIALSLGIGCVLSSGVSYGLARILGVLDRHGRHANGDPART